MDPLAPSYPWNSTYAFAENSPISAIDLDGLERYVIIENYNSRGNILSMRVHTYEDINGQLVDQNVTGLNGVTVPAGDVLTIRRQNGTNSYSGTNSLTPRQQFIYNRIQGKRTQNGGFVDFFLFNIRGDIDATRISTTDDNGNTRYIFDTYRFQEFFFVNGGNRITTVTNTVQVQEQYIDNTFNLVDTYKEEESKTGNSIYDVSANALKNQKWVFSLKGSEEFIEHSLNELRNRGVNIDQQYRPDLPLNKTVKTEGGSFGEIQLGQIKTRTVERDVTQPIPDR